MTNEELSQPDCEVDASGELLASMNSAVRSVTWEQVKHSVAKDTEMVELVAWIKGGCPGTKGDLAGNVQKYWGIRGELSVSEGVPLYGERTIILRSLRNAVLKTLHSAHQGVTGMTLRVGVSVYYGIYVDRFTNWPGIYMRSDAADVTTVLAKLCQDYGVPLTCTTV